MALIRLLHLSDLHIVNRNRLFYKINGASAYDPDALKALAEFVYKNKDAIDAILISGDISHVGLPADLSMAVEFLISPSCSPEEPWLGNKRKPTLNTFQKPIIIVPGNHDRFDGLLSQPNGIMFDNFFSAFWRTNKDAVQFFCLPDDSQTLLTVICADFTLKTFKDCHPGGHWGQGKVYRDRLRQLIQHTKKINSTKQNSAVIWMLHFAPKFDNLSFYLKLLCSGILIRQAEKLGIQYILCGHTHRYAIYKTGTRQGVKIHCAGTATCINSTEDTAIHFLEIETDANIIKNFRCLPLWWNPAQSIFQLTKNTV